MTLILLFIGLIVGLNCIPLLTKRSFPMAEKATVKLLVVTTLLFLALLCLAFYGYRLKGQYSFTAIAVSFIFLTIVYFVLFKNTKIKILLTTFFLTPLLVISIFLVLFRQVLKEADITEKSKIIVTTGGFLACGELIYITQTKFIILDKEVHYESNLCLRGIEKIKLVKIDNTYAEFLIYHDGKIDSENPYHYEVEISNVW